MADHKKHRNPDHVRRGNVPGPENETLQARFEELLRPAIYAQLAYYCSLKMWNQILGLPLMITAILALLWRQIPSAAVTNEFLPKISKYTGKFAHYEQF